MQARPLVLIGVLVLTALGLTVAADLTNRLPGDLALERWVQTGLPGSVAAGLSSLVAWISAAIFVAFGGAGGLVLIARRRLVEAASLVAAAATSVCVPIGKAVIDRPRPPQDLVNVLPRDDTGSYPSGHVFLAVTILGALFVYAPSICGGHRRLTLALRVVLAFVIVDVGLSRIYRGAHWPSDVVGTYLIAGLALYSAIRLYDRFGATLVRRSLERLGMRRLPQPDAE